jgi:PAS domain S-box-containing protein
MYSNDQDGFDSRNVQILEKFAKDLAHSLTFVLRTRAERYYAVEALQESQLKLEEAQRIAHLGHWERDLTTNLLDWSDEVYRILGMQPDGQSVPFSKFLRLIHPEDRARMFQTVNDAVRDSRCYDVEYRIVRATGEVRFVHSKANIIRDDAGRPSRAFGILQDVTERHLAKAALESANRALEAKNVAMEEVLARIQMERNRIGYQINRNAGETILPLLHLLKQGAAPEQQRRIEQIEQGLEEIVSPFIDKVSRAVGSLTPTELRICNLIKRGLVMKEIADLQYLSPATIAVHRRNIRHKLGIARRKVNLTSYLQHFFEEIPTPER